MSAGTVRRSFYAPAKLTAELVHDVLGLVTRDPAPLARIRGWTDTELLVAYDWAVREHLGAAGNPVRRRPRPTYTGGS